MESIKRPNNYKIGKWDKPATYAVKHKDLDIRMASRSGGIFTALSDKTLESQGAVYGCVLDPDFNAVHIKAERAEDRNRMRGSKYIQSDLRDIFSSVKEELDNDRKVLFSGTSCQVAGLKGFLSRDYEHLLCVDIVCHGVPSPKVWKDYIHWQELKNHSAVKKVDFRNKKKFGWRAHVESLILENGNQVDSTVFTTLFYEHSILRPCCYHCPYKDTIHPGNITIADYWGIDTAAPGFNDDKGVSLVLINDDKGHTAFEAVRDRLIIRKTQIEDSMQPPLIAPFNEPKTRMSFWRDYFCNNFEAQIKKYGGYGISARIRKKIRRIINKMINFIKRVLLKIREFGHAKGKHYRSDL